MAIFSTAYLPPVNYLSLLGRKDEILIEAHETYPRQTYRNRCRILTANGPLNLSIPVHKPHGNRTKTKDIKISYRENWQQMHLRAIESAYNASPFYLFYKDELAPFFRKKKYENLLEYNTRLLQTVLVCCGIDTQINFTNTFQQAIAEDFRNHFSPKTKPDTLPAYPQVFSHKFGFAAGLSIIDLLFNMGPETKTYLQKLDTK